MKIKKRVTVEAFVLVIVLLAVMLVEAGGAGLYIFHLNKTYKDQVNDLMTQISQNKKAVLIPKEKIKSGTMLTMEMFQKVMAFTEVPQGSYLTQEDIEGTIRDANKTPDMKVGRWSLIDIDLGTPVLKNMTIDEKITSDVRREELNVFMLQSNLAKGEFVDIRICYPNGEDYIIASKKNVRDIQVDKNTIWLWLTDKEIMTVSSAIVDAYLHKGTKLYVVTYVAPSIQQLSQNTYPVNLDVIKAIQNDPNILAEAKAALSEQLRKELEERINKMSAQDLASIQAGVTQEQAGRNAKIATDSAKAQQQQQSSASAPQTTPVPQTAPSTSQPAKANNNGKSSFFPN